MEKLVLQTKVFNMGEPKALLALALEPPNLDDIEKTILLLKEVWIHCVNPLKELIKHCHVAERGIG